MPTYEYRCPKGHEFELFQRISDEPVAKCPECGKKSQRLLSSGAGLVFKGSGFYITENRSDSYKQAEKKEGPESSSSKTDGTGTSSSSSSKKEGGDASTAGKSEKKSSDASGD
jgi:putative FmdB family regulatory protein